MRIATTLHCGPELGVGQAARLHVAAAHPDLRHAIDGHYHHYVDDVLVGGKLRYVGRGDARCPEAPGLGVELDEARLERWAYTPERQREWEAFWEETKRANGIGPSVPGRPGAPLVDPCGHRRTQQSRDAQRSETADGNRRHR